MRWCAVAAMMLCAALAHANGRPPLTNGIHFRPGDPHSLYVATTFGLLISHDDGCTFRWVCESNVGYGGPFDPKYAIAQDGTIFASTYHGLRVSRDGGCSFTTATSDIWIDALDIGPDGHVWIATADGTQPNDILASTDGGTNFVSKGMLSPTIWWKSVKVAPSNAQRVYVTGYQVAGALPDGGQMPPTGHFFTSSDAGAHWTESALAGVQYGSTPTPIVAAVDAANPDIVFMVSLMANAPTGDRLYRSSDGGATFTEVLATTDAIRGVVIRDAANVLVATQMGGSFASTNGGMSFTPLATAPQLACLGQRSDGMLIGCGANWQPDYMSIALSGDGGASWSKVWRFVELYGPLECADGTTEHDVCAAQQWPNLQQMFGATGPTCGPLKGQVFGGSALQPDTSPPAPKKSGGCCDTGGAGAAGSAAWALIIGALLRRRRAASAS